MLQKQQGNIDMIETHLFSGHSPSRLTIEYTGHHREQLNLHSLISIDFVL